MNAYAYRRAARNRAVPADVVGEELINIWKSSGEQLEPATVVASARAETSPIHPCFEWRDHVAAEQHRLWQARELIKSVRVVKDDGGSEPLFFHVSLTETPAASFYQTGSVLRVEPKQYLAALAEAKRKLDSAAESFQEVQRLLSSTGESDHALGKIAAIVSALTTARSISATLQ